ncbi:hypothetical protein JTB14_013016 [Gonioctena quinquepunctata]|nr:hypothetical protein JTB14_013016 [Gonioctena quinquepunctata]
MIFLGPPLKTNILHETKIQGFEKHWFTRGCSRAVLMEQRAFWESTIYKEYEGHSTRDLQAGYQHKLTSSFCKSIFSEGAHVIILPWQWPKRFTPE